MMKKELKYVKTFETFKSKPKKYKVSNIDYDIDSEDEDGGDVNINDLPKTLTIEVPDDLNSDDEIHEYISNKISNITGYTHYGFSTTPKLSV